METCIVFAFISGGGSLVGLKVSNFIIKKFKDSLLLYLLLILFFLLSMCLLIYNGIIEYNFKKFTIRNICKL